MEFEISKSKLDSVHTEISQNECTTIPILDANELSYQKFFENHLLKNIPCVVKNIANNWESTRNWQTNGEPNLNYLYDKYRDTKTIIYNCSERYFNSQKCEKSTLGTYIELLRTKGGSLYYLKDWHLKLQSKNDEFYEVPIYFASDWLNEYFIQCTKDDYRFVYMGEKMTWTPLHADVFNSYSWSVNICGQKRWLLFPPGEEKYLRDDLNNIPYDIEEISHSRKCFELVQNTGEAIFVPSGWYHQVWNLKDTISINHNWVNGCNISKMWESLKNNLDLIKKEIDDCKNMDNFKEHCQIMLNSLFGMNCKQFYEFLTFIAMSRLKMMESKGRRMLYHGHFIGTYHILFDLFSIHKVLKDFLNCDYLDNSDCYVDGQSILNDILQMLQTITTV